MISSWDISKISKDDKILINSSRQAKQRDARKILKVLPAEKLSIGVDLNIFSNNSHYFKTESFYTHYQTTMVVTAIVP